MRPGMDPQNGSFQKDYLEQEMVRGIFWDNVLLKNFLSQQPKLSPKFLRQDLKFSSWKTLISTLIFLFYWEGGN